MFIFRKAVTFQCMLRGVVSIPQFPMRSQFSKNEPISETSSPERKFMFVEPFPNSSELKSFAFLIDQRQTRVVTRSHGRYDLLRVIVNGSVPVPSHKQTRKLFRSIDVVLVVVILAGSVRRYAMQVWLVTQIWRVALSSWWRYIITQHIKSSASLTSQPERASRGLCPARAQLAASR